MLWHGWWRESLFFNLCTGTKHGCLQAKHVNHVFKTSFSDGSGYCKDITRPASPEHEDIQTKPLQLNSKLPFLWNFRGFSMVLTLFRAASLQPVCRRRRLKTFQIFQALHPTQVWQKPWAQADWVQIWVITTLNHWSYNKRYQEEV